MNFTFEIAGSQIDGERDYQEDAFLITHLNDDGEGDPSSLVIVADGMGGHAAGNVASNMAVQAVNKYITSHHPSDDLAGVLRNAAKEANKAIRETIRETSALKGMGCTLVAAVFEKNYLRWVSVGDSHLYLLRNGHLEKKNEDHSYGGFLDKMAAEGKQIEPESGYSRNMLLSALTGDEIAAIDCPETSLELNDGDRIIICSDGLDTLSRQRILAVSEDADSAKACSDALLTGVEAEKTPRQDNVTVVVIDVSARPGQGRSPTETVEPPTMAEDEIPTEPILLPPAGAAGKSVNLKENAGKANSNRKKIPPTYLSHPRKTHKTRRQPILWGLGVILLSGIGIGIWLMMGIESPPEPDAVTDAEEKREEAPSVARAVGEKKDAERPAEAIPKGADKKATAAKKPERPDAVGKTVTFSDPLESGGKGPEMVPMPADSFEMGSKLGSGKGDDRPQHTVKLNPFAISKHEVTFAEYERFARATRRPIPKKSDSRDKKTHPVTYITWDDAQSYTGWLSQQTGHHYRLPSEAEWEYAAAAKTTSHFWWGNKMKKDMAHCFECSETRDPQSPVAVGSFKPNAFGLYDTAGNVAEWVRDCYHDNYRDAPTDGSAWESGECTRRVARGGYFRSPAKDLHTTRRDKYDPDRRYEHVGFRVARDLSP